MSQKTLFTKSALAVAVALISTQAWSAGFQLNEFSSSGLGVARRISLHGKAKDFSLAVVSMNEVYCMVQN
ncbi:hypothetical protein L3W71_03505 [Escherichia coli]|nr:hypothetical protein [Escherichia coli]MCF7302077.1 hypothetical protein [Escherichia coli]